MLFRFEDQGLTLRLFVSKESAESHTGAEHVVKYAVGWLVKNNAGRWVDAYGLLPLEWQPQEHLLRCNAAG